MTYDYRIVTQVVIDNGYDGIFWRKGERWLREKGNEYRLLDIAPNLESSRSLDVLELQARDASMSSCSGASAG